MKVETEVTVVCPTHNSAGFVERTLATVAEQTRRPAELIVCDDGSSDQTCAIVEALAPKMPFLTRLLRLPHRGPGAARNAGIRAARTPWIAFLDSDDLWVSEKLECMAAAMMRAEGGDIFCHGIDHWRLDGSRKEIDFSLSWKPGVPVITQLYRRNFLTPSALVCRREALEACGMFDETLLSSQDYELWMRLTVGRKIVLVPEILGCYVERAGNISSGPRYRRLANMLRVLWRHRRQVDGVTLAWAVSRAILSYLRDALTARRFKPQRSHRKLSPSPRVAPKSAELSRRVFGAAHGLMSWCRLLSGRESMGDDPALRVLLFHDVPREHQAAFANLLKSLAQKWRFLDAATFMEVVAGKTRLAERSLLLTFDDGFASNARVAREVLDSLGIKAIFFIPTDFILCRSGTESRQFVARQLFDGLVDPAEVPDEMIPMEVGDLRDLVARGHTIGSHTKTHTRLSRVMSLHQLQEEIIASARWLENELNCAVTHFAFPFGNPSSVNSRVLALCLDRYGLVYSGSRGLNLGDTPHLAIRRDSFQPNDSVAYVDALLDGGADRLYLKHRRHLDLMAERAERIATRRK